MTQEQKSFDEVLARISEGLRRAVELASAVLREDAVQFEYDPNGPDLWRCRFCSETAPVLYKPPGEAQPMPNPFPHAAGCAVVLALALLVDGARQ